MNTLAKSLPGHIYSNDKVRLCTVRNLQDASLISLHAHHPVSYPLPLALGPGSSLALPTFPPLSPALGSHSSRSLGAAFELYIPALEKQEKA
jgi:hypothetical protein